VKTYKQFAEAAALVAPAIRMAPYVIPAIGGAAKVLQQVMPIDASDKFKARQRPGRITAGEAQRRQAIEDRKAEARRRVRENTPKSGTNVENVPANAGTTTKKTREKVDPRLERIAGQILDRLRNEGVEPLQTEGMLPVPSDIRKSIINPPQVKETDKEDKFKQQYDKKFKTYDKKIRDLKKELKADNKHRDEKLNYQYKQLQDPKDPKTSEKLLKKV